MESPVALSVGSLLKCLLPISETEVRAVFSKNFHSILQKKVQTMVQKLETEILPKIKAIKEEIETRFGGENQSLIQWLRELDDVICEAEDILDEYKYKHLEGRVRRKQHAYVRSFYSFTCHVHYVSTVEALLKRLDHMSSRVDHYFELLRSDHFDDSRSAAHARPLTTSVLNEKVFGREKVIAHVTNLLTKDAMPPDRKKRPISDDDDDDDDDDDEDEDEQNYQILPIIGVGGVGKTFLAKCVYHQSKVIQHFDLRMWVHVPEDFSEVNITTSMVELASDQACPDTKNLNELQRLLSKHIKEKKVLLVLDDVWYDEKSTKLANKLRWMRLFAPLRQAHPESMILVTSRMKLVADILTSTREPVILKGLEEDTCLALFNRYVFGIADQQTPNNHLRELAKKIVTEKIVARFGGLPLAVISVAGILARRKLDDETWNHILRSDNTIQDVVKTLMVSYQRLPQHLQQFVAHHSIFPRGMALSRHYLVHSWIGEGFITDSVEEGNGFTVEDIASGYLDELVSRSFFQRRDDGLFVLHHLMHEVADYVTKDVCIRIEDDTMREIPPTIKHLRIDVEKLAKYKRKIRQLKNLRTLIVTCKSSSIKVPIHNYLLGKILKSTKRLRVLCLASCHIDQLPEWLGDLQHLRLLDLSNLQVERLPRSVRRLYHLLYLNLINFKTDSMPSSLSKLINLRRIMSDAAILNRFGKIGEITTLQKLPPFSVEKKKGHKIKELKKLNMLRGELRISNLQNVCKSKEAAEGKLKKKTCLRKLYLEWNDDNSSTSANDPMEKVLDELQPPHQISKLEIVRYAGTRPPIWMQHSQHSLSCLRVLILNQWMGTLPLLSQWVPQLHQLELKDCFKLRYLPSLPLNLGKLLLSGCYSLAIITEADMVKEYMQEMKAGFDSRPFAVIEEEIKTTESLEKNDRVMTELKRVKQFLEARGFALEPSSSSLLATLQSWGLSRKHDAIHDKLTTKMQSIDGNMQTLPSSIQQLHLGDCLVDDNELLNCIRKLTLLTSFVLAGCYNITTLPSKKVLSKLTQLQELQIKDCVLLTSLGGLQALPSLRMLNICSCPNLLALIPSEDNSSIASALLPESLINLAITDCELMTKDIVSRCLRGLTRLECLSLQQLKHMTSLPSTNELLHLTSIESLTLKDCEKLVSMGGLHKLSSLNSIHVHRCPGLLKSYIDNGSLCVSNITVDNLSLLPALLSRKGLASLQVLSIIDQDVPFTPKQEEHLERLTSLQTLSFKNCESLSSLPSNLECLTSLKRLYIENCPQINSSAILPASLQLILDGN